MRLIAACVGVVGVFACVPGTAMATHCPPVPTMVSFEPAPGETVTAACDETATPFTFDAVEPGTTGSFTRVRPTSQSPAVPAAPYGGRWSARVTRASRTDSVLR